MSEKITIRTAVLDDVLTMFKLIDEILDSPSTDDELQERYERYAPRFGKDSTFIYYVAENEQKKMIGLCSGGETLQCNRTVNDKVYDCEIAHMFVHQEYQHRGIGRELWRTIWNAIVERFHPNNLIVWGANREQAHRFYRSAGGTLAGTKNLDSGILTAYVWNDLQLLD
ncbi:unnamed protein product [Adineta ricciae]|uniref:N-acetyltransferase domain-containing protein n=1 Tax=Adineta ricciae TaxID=249248 RepID=A0A815EL86_ADIRI|nr:unnamed protein product [Adineta ricciae]CAF1311874.1 unnamed protein product [Adineta ricciae]